MTINGFGSFDAVDISAVTSTATFGGDVANNTSGLALLSSSHTVAFFNTTSDTLYIDVNHDQVLDTAHDMQIHITNFDTFASGNLIS